jgi:hypothetical protein
MLVQHSRMFGGRGGPGRFAIRGRGVGHAACPQDEENQCEW